MKNMSETSKNFVGLILDIWKRVSFHLAVFALAFLFHRKCQPFFSFFQFCNPNCGKIMKMYLQPIFTCVGEGARYIQWQFNPLTLPTLGPKLQFFGYLNFAFNICFKYVYQSFFTESKYLKNITNTLKSQFESLPLKNNKFPKA